MSWITNSSRSADVVRFFIGSILYAKGVAIPHWKRFIRKFLTQGLAAMDAIRNLRTRFFEKNGLAEKPSKTTAQNPMDSARIKSGTHLSQEVGGRAQVHIQVDSFTQQNPAAKSSSHSSASSASVSNDLVTLATSQAKSASPSQALPTNSPASTSQASSGTAATQTQAGTPTTFTPAKKIPFNADMQDYLFSKLRPPARALVSEHNLTKKEAAAIHAYTMEKYYRTMNAALRAVNKDGNVDVSSAEALKNAGITDDGLAHMIAATVSGMQKLPPAQTSNEVFLPLGRNDSVPDQFLEPYAQGASITISAFYSSTVSMGTVESWWDNSDHFISVLQNVNGNGRDISAFSEFESEQEVLFMPGTQFIVLGRTEKTETPLGLPDGSSQTKTKILMQLQEVSSNPNDPLPPTIHPSTFQSLSPALQQPKPKKTEPSASEKKSTYWGLR